MDASGILAFYKTLYFVTPFRQLLFVVLKEFNADDGEEIKPCLCPYSHKVEDAYLKQKIYKYLNGNSIKHYIVAINN